MVIYGLCSAVENERERIWLTSDKADEEKLFSVFKSRQLESAKWCYQERLDSWQSTPAEGAFYWACLSETQGAN